jgi:hypothetical protein
MNWTRRRCPDCGQIMVEEEGSSCPCPACGRQIGPESIIPEDTEEEPPAEALDDEEKPENESDEPDAEEWNLGEPMHRVLWFCLVAPNRLPLAVMFRSLRWVFSFAWIGQILLQGGALVIGSALLVASADEVNLLREIAAASAKQVEGGPEARRLRIAQEQLCTLTMIGPEQRLLCALNPSLSALKNVGEQAKGRLDAIERLRQPSDPEAWLSVLGDAMIFLLMMLVPLWGMLGLARHADAFALALKVIAFGQVPMAVSAVISALLMSFAGTIGLSLGLTLLVSGFVWSMAASVGCLIRFGSLAQRQAVMTVLVILLFNLTMLTSLAGNL